jgi:hypothetical protein
MVGWLATEIRCYVADVRQDKACNYCRCPSPYPKNFWLQKDVVGRQRMSPSAIDPILTNVGVRYWVPNSAVAGAKNTHRVSDQYNCGMLRREHFVDLFRRRLYHLTFIVSHF